VARETKSRIKTEIKRGEGAASIDLNHRLAHDLDLQFRGFKSRYPVLIAVKKEKGIKPRRPQSYAESVI